MISNPNLVFYACIAKGSIILGEFLPRERGISEVLAQQCVERTPPHHSMFSQTLSNRTCTFLINDPFTYFGIFDENIQKSELLGFLNGIKSSFEEIFARGSVLDFDNMTSRCLQSQFDAVFCESMGLDLEFLNSSRSGSKDDLNSSLDFSRGRMVGAPLPGTPKGLKKKKRASAERGGSDGNAKDVNGEKKVDVYDDVLTQKNVLFAVDRQKAKQIWKKHVWVVLALDLVICVFLFGIWLLVCRGFQCIDG
ncbi:phytolongin Phyl2.2-like [Mangifera indica]|uniref:phytolongin Phyl2.2-like n=1 Tax=Mangifera indica TaxID=29780 RepID=UPI001CFB07FE|nr:phytolongin Phyl2.2-like [Mangifera indica]